MKIITSTLVVLTALSVSIVAQKSSATEPVLTIKFFRWYESVSHLPCDDCLCRIAAKSTGLQIQPQVGPR
jgi:hypothetical protein